MTPTTWWLELIGVAASLIAAVMLAVSQRPAPDNVHGSLVLLRNPNVWRWGFVALIAGSALHLLVLVWMPPAGTHAHQSEAGGKTADVVEAQRFVLKDARGTMRAELHARHPSQGVVLDLYDENALHIAELSETGLAIWGRTGSLYGVLEIVADTARLAFKSRPPGATGSFTTRAELTVQPKAGARITLHGEDGKLTWRAP